MRRPVRTNRFKKDVELMVQRGKDGRKLVEVIRRLTGERPMDPKYRDHPLLGKCAGRRECHVEPDWLLVYKLEESSIIFERTGTHADLFR